MNLLKELQRRNVIRMAWRARLLVSAGDLPAAEKMSL